MKPTRGARGRWAARGRTQMWEDSQNIQWVERGGGHQKGMLVQFVPFVRLTHCTCSAGWSWLYGLLYNNNCANVREPQMSAPESGYPICAALARFFCPVHFGPEELCNFGNNQDCHRLYFSRQALLVSLQNKTTNDQTIWVYLLFVSNCALYCGFTLMSCSVWIGVSTSS